MPAYEINFSAQQVLGTGILIGMMVCPSTDGIHYVPATLVNRNAVGGRISGIAITSPDVNGTFTYQCIGDVGSSITAVSLGAGASSFVGINDTSGYPMRVSSSAAVIIGRCDTLGNMTLTGGGTGGGSSSATTFSAAGTIVAGQAVVLTSSTQVNVASSTNLTGNLLHYGVAQNGGSIGATITVFIPGSVVDHSVTGLGAGGAVAVGTDSSGNLKRVTDTALASGLKFIGYCDASGNLTVGPIHKPWADITDFGAIGDDTTDDLPAIYACIQQGFETVYVPAKKFFLNGYLEIRQACTLQGAGSYRDITTGFSQFRFPAGAGIIVQWQPDSAAANKTRIRDLTLLGAQLTIPTYATGTGYVVGNIVRTPTNDDNRYWFECLKAGTTSATIWNGSTGGPDFRWYGGQPYTGQPWAANTVYKTGDRVHVIAQSTTRFWECTTAGTSQSGSPPTFNTTVGATTAEGPNTLVWTTVDATGGYWVNDNGVIWATRQGSGIWAKIIAYVEYCKITGFTGYGILEQTNVLGRNDADISKFNNNYISLCGGGIACRGTDGGNASTWIGNHCDDAGFNWGGGNTGGVSFWDGSFIGVYQFGNHSEGNNGPAYITACADVRITTAYPDSSTPLSRAASNSTVVACYDEGTGLPGIVGNGHVFGGIFSANWDYIHSQGQIIDSTGANGLFAQDQKANQVIPQLTGATDIHNLPGVQIMPQGSMTAMVVSNSDNKATASQTLNLYAYNLSQTQGGGISTDGWWQNFVKDSAGNLWVSHSVSGSAATDGAGWEWQPRGEFKGDNGGSTAFRYWQGYDVKTLGYTDDRRASHHYAIGERWKVLASTGTAGQAGTYEGWIVVQAGYRATHYVVGQTVNVGTWIEPSANLQPIPAPGSKVFKCTTRGTGIAPAEPMWTTPTTTDANGNVWTFQGNVPNYNLISGIDAYPQGTLNTQAGTDFRLIAYVTTTNAGAATVDTVYQPVASHSATIRIQWNVRDTSTLKTAGALTMAVVRNGAGTLTIAGAGAGTSTFGDAAVNTSGIAFTVSGNNTLQIQATPPAAYSGTLDWEFCCEIMEN